ncbi:MAG: PAS domain-containing protein [Burkholderiales bacterium]|nr:PAS domain-containing protein [Burkholderiales bacterium]
MNSKTAAAAARILLPAEGLPRARPLTAASRETFWRSLQTFNATRVVIAVVLLIFLTVNPKKDGWSEEHFFYVEACALYLVGAIGFASLALKYQRRFLLQLLFQVLGDVTVISLLYVGTGGAKSGLAILYLFPLAGCAILAPLVWALFFVAVTTLILLAESGYRLVNGAPDVSISQAGLYGAAFFAAVFVVSRLAAKLIKQEDLAARHGKALQLQQAINRLVIADMGDGILVVSNNGTIVTANPAAERMLSIGVIEGDLRFKLTSIAALAPIAEAFFGWIVRSQNGEKQDADCSAYVKVKPNDEPTFQGPLFAREPRREVPAHLKLRFAKVEGPGLNEDRTVIFLQDVTEIENQAQQLKLASMGRLTASIAHEVRNPLSAISYAASLLAEESPQASQQRLLSIVGDNVARLNRMVEDILKLSRKAQTQGEPLALAPFLSDVVGELRAAQNLASDLIETGAIGDARVRFDPLHLREVVMNLLANAVRYASGRPGSIRIQTVRESAHRLLLQVQDDGAPITSEIRAHLFEPFYTTSSKGTGLGLYLARELCLNNGAMLDYEYFADETRDGGRFVIALTAVND